MAEVSSFVRNRHDLEDLCKRRFFFRQGAEIYGGTAGFFTYGPPGCAVKTNIISRWRSHFVIEEQLMEIEDANIMPHPVLKASGHVDRFNDFMVRDTLNPDKFYRADKLLEEVMEAKLKEAGVSAAQQKEYNIVKAQADAYTKEELMGVFEKYGIKAPDSGNELSEPFEFNLMFPVPIGPFGFISGYLRPETAQGIFLNYKYCLEQNANRLPFGIAQVGKSYRNEIAPRAGLTRQREFTQAEIEYFVKPTAKAHPKFGDVSSLNLQLFPSTKQLAGEEHVDMLLGDAVRNGIVNNETLGYMIARTYLFLVSVGIKPAHLRFRQHLPTEMAHYATDCWDAEIETCYGWLECVGIADRACFDLNAHAEAAKVDLSYREALETPIEREVLALTKKAGIATMKAFKKEGRAVKEWLEKLPQEKLKEIVDEVSSKGSCKRDACNGEVSVEFLPEHVECEVKKEKQTTEVFMPGVIEPSFGIDRILFSVLEHAYYERPKEKGEEKGDKQVRGVLQLPPDIAPHKLAILPLDQRIARNDKFQEVSSEMIRRLSELGISSTTDISGAAIGRRYARNDELGIPLACTFDFTGIGDESIGQVGDGRVTLRERDSMVQVRLSPELVPDIVDAFCSNRKSWSDIAREFPAE